MEPRALLLLGLAIAAEIIATSCLKASQGFTRPAPSVVVVLGYSAAFYCLALALKTIPIGIAYAIWSGVGTAVVAVIGWAVFHERLSLAQALGIGLIVLGTVLLQLTTRAGEAGGAG